MAWHVDPELWSAYAQGVLDASAEANLESHVAGCADCRAGARREVGPETTDVLWRDVRTTIETPALRPPLRVLQRLGARDDDLVALSVADSLLLPWAVAVASAIVCACVVGLAGLGAESRDAAFLALAPIAPVLAVVASYDALDPLREVTAPTAYSRLRLALLRSALALTVAVPATLAVGLLVPGMDGLAFVWLAPSLGLTVAALVLLTWFDARAAGGLVAGGWLGLVALLRASSDAGALTTPLVQAAFVVSAAVLSGALFVRTSTVHWQGGAR